MTVRHLMNPNLPPHRFPPTQEQARDLLHLDLDHHREYNAERSFENDQPVELPVAQQR